MAFWPLFPTVMFQSVYIHVRDAANKVAHENFTRFHHNTLLQLQFLPTNGRGQRQPAERMTCIYTYIITVRPRNKNSQLSGVLTTIAQPHILHMHAVTDKICKKQRCLCVKCRYTGRATHRAGPTSCTPSCRCLLSASARARERAN